METQILYKLFEQYNITDVLPQIQNYVDEYNWHTEVGLKRYYTILLKQKTLLKSKVCQLNSLINFVDKAIWNFYKLNNLNNLLEPCNRNPYSHDDYLYSKNLNETKKHLNSNLNQIDKHRNHI